MRFDDGVIAASLDDTWRTVPAVKRLLQNGGRAEGISEGLRLPAPGARRSIQDRVLSAFAVVE
jgi:hypothetical protein